jgi:hypothetical protein
VQVLIEDCSDDQYRSPRILRRRQHRVDVPPPPHLREVVVDRHIVPISRQDDRSLAGELVELVLGKWCVFCRHVDLARIELATFTMP